MPSRVPNTAGGGSRTNLNGLAFEARANLRDAFEAHPLYNLVGDQVYRDAKLVATYYEKNGLYNNLLAPRGVDYRKILSKKLLPDGVLMVDDTLYIIEKKYQATAGSVDEKLQTCDFKKRQYVRLLTPLNLKVEYYYVLNDWFKKPEYSDVFKYIKSVGCRYFFNVVPLKELGL